MHPFVSTVDARRLFVASIIARLPEEMLSIGLLVHVQHLTGSFAAAGVVTGVYAIGVGVGGPLLGRLVDRRGQTSVLLASAGASALMLVTIAALPAGSPLGLPIALATGIGFATPPVGACLRAQLPALLSHPDAVRRAFALEASILELTYISAPRSRFASVRCGRPARLLWSAASSCSPRRSHSRCNLPRVPSDRHRLARHRTAVRWARRRCGRL
jgi:MFS family permease